MDYNIFNKNTLKITQVLMEAENKLYLNQIYELTKIKSKNNLVKNLNMLVNFNILEKEKNKSNTFYSLNYENILTLSFFKIINTIKLQKLPFERRKAIEESLILTKPNMAVLFGSTAKKNFTRQSDIDILFVYNEKTKINLSEISGRYGVKINIISLKFDELDEKSETIRHILKTGYPLTGNLYFYKILNRIKNLK